jgi:pilus assembly protein CpaE
MAEKKIRVMIVDDVETTQKSLARLLSFEPDMDVVGFAATGGGAIAEAQLLKPDVILMDINMPDMDGLTATRQITGTVPCAVVMISVQSDRDYMRRALQAGAVDFLPKPPSADELYTTVRNAYDRRLKMVIGPGAGAEEETRPTATGHVIVVYSPQGGAGVTTLAVNIASGLMTQGDRTVLVDANLQFGDIAIQLDIRGEHSVIDLAKASGHLDPDLIENVLMTHGSGLRVLTAPRGPEDAGLVSAEAMLEIIQTLANQFKYVVVDTSSHLDRLTINLLEAADLLILVGIPTLPSVKNLKVMLALFDQSPEFNPGKIMFVLNRVSLDKRSGALNPEDISRNLKLSIKGFVPAVEKPFLESLNRGVPAVVNARQSPGRELLSLAQEIKTILVAENDVEALPEGLKHRQGLL